MFTNGWFNQAVHCPSTHFNERPKEAKVNLLVIHNISLPPNCFEGDNVEQFFTGKLDCSQHEYFSTIKDLKVSSHFYIKRNGKLIQFVSVDKRAWHAGESLFKGKVNCNDFSVGIELEGADHITYTNEQYKQLHFLTQCLQSYFPNINKENIVGHCDIAPQRKTDPGESFNWKRYLQAL